MSALNVSSRASLAAIGNRLSGDNVLSAKLGQEVRIFGVARAETVVSSIFLRAPHKSGPMPEGLWQLLSGHLVGVACASPVAKMRSAATRAFVRIMSAALESRVSNLLAQGRVVVPLRDLLSSPFPNARERCLDVVYAMLETRGNFLKGSGAWTTILGILRLASRMECTDTGISPRSMALAYDDAGDGSAEGVDPSSDSQGGLAPAASERAVRST